MVRSQFECGDDATDTVVLWLSLTYVHLVVQYNTLVELASYRDYITNYNVSGRLEIFYTGKQSLFNP
jgi:hypothetical protein